MKIGVLGGIGPEATGIFYNDLIKRLQDKKLIKNNKDFPQIIVNSIPAPELIFEEIKKEELEPYIKGLKELEKFGVDFIVMVCNTIHLYYDRLQKAIKTPILDVRKEVKKTLDEKGIKSTVIIGSPNAIKKGLYRFEGIKTYEPTSEEQKQLSEAIFNYNKGFEKEKQVEKVRQICKSHMKNGAETILLACTETALMLRDSDLPLIDSMNVLIETTIKKIKQEKKICM
jgi:aspartate racemase